MTNPNNYVDFTGRLTTDPKFQASANGKSATVFITLAVKDNFKTRGEYKTNFISLQKIVSTNAQVDYHKQFRKGDTVKAMCSVEINVTKNQAFTNVVINSIYPLVKATKAPAKETKQAVTTSEQNNEILLKENNLPF